MINILKPYNKHSDNFDLVSGKDFISSIYESTPTGGIPLSNFANFPWKALELLGIECKEFKEEVEYLCPWTGNKFYRFVPVRIYSEDFAKYKKNFKDNLHADYLFDEEWHKSSEVIFQGLTASFAGHGYDQCILPSDGSGEWKQATIRLDNEDIVLGFLWIWYNK